MAESELKQLQESVGKGVVDLTRTTAQLAAEDLGFFRVSHPKETKQLNKSSKKILQLSRQLLKCATAETSIVIPPFSNVDSLEDGWPAIVEAVDTLLEKTDFALDEFTGVIKKQDLEAEAPKKIDLRRPPYTKRSAIPKPQLNFKRAPHNHSASAFKPLLRSKPHAAVPLSPSLATTPTEVGLEQYDTNFYLCIKDSSPLKSCIDALFRSGHPYAHEVEEYRFPPAVHEYREPIPFTPVANSEATFVNTLPAVHQMLAELKQASEIAVDLEHHDKHSYIGIVSLMQISTRTKDWIVDTLLPWREELQILNEVFADPSILKVFHGATMDMVWLQRDLGLYVVGLFDTYHACVALSLPGRSLAFLLDKYAGVKAQKQYQTADWRIRTRPLPTELLEYARADTHFLLYIYDNLRNELIELGSRLPPADSPLDKVLQGSKYESLRKYEHPRYDAVRGTGPDGWYNLLIRTPSLFTKQQFSVFRAVHQWRDQVARDEDESINFVMQKQTLFNIARAMPTTRKDLHTVASPMSDLLRERVSELLSVIETAIEAGESGPDMKKLLDEHPETIAFKARKNGATFRAETESQNLVFEDVVRRELQQTSDNTIPLINIQAPASLFWGSTIASRQIDETVSMSPCLEVPLPPHLSGVDAAGADISATDAEIAHTLSTNGEQGAISDTSVGHASKKRKNQATDENGPSTLLGRAEESMPALDLPAPPSDPMLDDMMTLDAEPDAKRARKAARKAEKAQLKAERAAKVQAQQDEAAFDYASAPSVLHARPTKSKVQGLDPYQKATDTSKGARRTRRDVPGKSATFKQ